ncbi:hypothetical protein CN918_32155 [Priestia megaterium]|nr:hypothetical protein CN918_32155 [Priestia megaterium]
MVFLYIGCDGMPIYVLIFFFLINLVPSVRRFLRITSTMFHELGHALMALLCSGKLHRIYLYQNGSGAAITSNSNWLSRFLTSIAGYPFEVFIVLLFTVLMSFNKIEVLLYILFGTTLFSLLFIRNLFGWLWVIIIGSLSVFALVGTSPTWVFYFAFFLVANMMVETIYSSVSICWQSYKYPKNAGDATSLAHLTKLPALLWGVLFLGFTIYVLILASPYVFSIKMPI